MCPDVAQYQYLLGVALMGAGDAVRATEALQAADRLEPGRPLTLAALGLALNNRKQFADAKTALTRSLELDPEKPETLAALAEAEASLGDLEAAEQHARARAGCRAGRCDRDTSSSGWSGCRNRATKKRETPSSKRPPPIRSRRKPITS